MLSIFRSSQCYRPRQISAEDLKLMRVISILHMDYPFDSSRLLRDLLVQHCALAGCRHMRTLMRWMTICQNRFARLNRRMWIETEVEEERISAWRRTLCYGKFVIVGAWQRRLNLCGQHSVEKVIRGRYCANGPKTSAAILARLWMRCRTNRRLISQLAPCPPLPPAFLN